MPRVGLDPDIVTRAAAVIVDADGVAALTLARLAVELGVAPPSLYKHVAGLDDLIVRVATLSIRRLTDILTTAALGRSGRQALVAIAHAHRRFAIEHAGLYALTQAAPEPRSAAQRAEINRTIGVLGAVVDGYGVPDHLSIHAIRLVRAGLHGFVDIEGRGGFQMPDSLDDSFLMIVDALDAALGGLGGRDGDPRRGTTAASPHRPRARNEKKPETSASGPEK